MLILCFPQMLTLTVVLLLWSSQMAMIGRKNPLGFFNYNVDKPEFKEIVEKESKLDIQGVMYKVLKKLKHLKPFMDKLN